MKTAARIPQFFPDSKSAQWGVASALCVGCLLLFALFLVPNAQFNNVPPLFAERASEKRDSPGGNESQREVESQDLPVQVLGMESKGRISDTSDVDERAVWMQQERVGANILIRSGYLKSATMTVDSSGRPPPQIRYSFEVNPEVDQCISLDDQQETGQEGSEQTVSLEELRNTAAQLALGAVAIEKFHRTVLHRRAEWAFAHAFLSVFGKLPDLSLGPAQIRPSRIRKISDEMGQSDGAFKEFYSVAHLRDGELANVLAGECRSLKLAATIMYYYLKKASQCASEHDTTKTKPPCPVEDWNIFAARNYIGQRRTTSAIIDYAPIVAGMADAMKPLLRILTISLPYGTVNRAYEPTKMEATGGTQPYKWSMEPALPTGLSLNPNTGIVSGTPTAVSPETGYKITVTDNAKPPSIGPRQSLSKSNHEDSVASLGYLPIACRQS